MTPTEQLRSDIETALKKKLCTPKDLVNTRLKVGDTFECSLIIEGEPLYLDNLRQDGHPPIAYVCGKKSGVFFEYVIPSS